MTVHCLVVDDDAAIRTLLQAFLQQHGFSAETLADGAALRQRLPLGGAQVLVLDLMLPDDNGLTLCQWAKQLQPGLAVIMLTAQGDPISRVLGLELGADDYLGKPFEPRELVARIKAVLRRGHSEPAPRQPGHEQRFAGWTFDRLRRQLVAPDGVVLALSAAEYRLLGAFVDHPGRVLSRDRLLDLTRAAGAEVNDRSIDLAVSRLRGKLGRDNASAALIRTLRGEGYLFDTRIE